MWGERERVSRMGKQNNLLYCGIKRLVVAFPPINELTDGLFIALH